MRRAAAVVLVVALLVAAVAPPADACLECVALGLASFAVFTQLVSAVAGPSPSSRPRTISRSASLRSHVFVCSAGTSIGGSSVTSPSAARSMSSLSAVT